MQLKSVNPVWVKLIKIVSPLVMMVALLIDGAIAYHWQHGLLIPKSYQALGAIGSVAVLAHTIEGIIAATLAHKKGLNPFRYGVYTFLVGTVAFLDLMDSES